MVLNFVWNKLRLKQVFISALWVHPHFTLFKQIFQSLIKSFFSFLQPEQSPWGFKECFQIWPRLVSNYKKRGLCSLNAVNAWEHMHRHPPPSSSSPPTCTHSDKHLCRIWFQTLSLSLLSSTLLTTFSVFLFFSLFLSFLLCLLSCCGELLSLTGGQRKENSRAVKKPLKEYFPLVFFCVASPPPHQCRCTTTAAAATTQTNANGCENFTQGGSRTPVWERGLNGLWRRA